MKIFKPIEDKFIRGLIAGITAGIFKDIPALAFRYILPNPGLTFWDYMSLLTIGRTPRSWDEYLLAVMVEVLWCIFLAIAFIYLRPKLKSRHYIIQGVGFGILIWLLIRGVVYFYRAPELIHSTSLTAVTVALISVFYGSTVAIIDRILESHDSK